MEYIVSNDDAAPGERIEAETPWEAVQKFFEIHPEEIHIPVYVMENT